MRAIAFGLMLTLTACGPGWKFEQSHAVYRNCIQTKGASNCQNEKALMDADYKAMNAYGNPVVVRVEKE